MQGFEYKYKSSEEIVEQMPHLGDFGPVEFGILGGVSFTVISLIFLIIPQLFKMKYSFVEVREKRKKKQMLHQIMIQKEIETQIEDEIKHDEETRSLKK